MTTIFEIEKEHREYKIEVEIEHVNDGPCDLFSFFINVYEPVKDGHNSVSKHTYAYDCETIDELEQELTERLQRAKSDIDSLAEHDEMVRTRCTGVVNDVFDE